MTKKRQLDTEETRIQRMIASDPDAPEATDAQLAQARPFTEAFPVLAEAMRRSAGGRPKLDAPKMSVSLRLDQDVVAHFKAGGPGWQSRMNRACGRRSASPASGAARKGGGRAAREPHFRATCGR